MSSLQQALDNAANKFNLKKLNDAGKKKGGSGAFESCFAQGLDISELISSPKNSAGESSNRTSAAEELLKVKQKERRKRQIQEEEEAKMQAALQKRLDSLKNRANQKEKVQRHSGFEIGDALVRMHGSDEMAASVLSRKVVGGASSRRRNSASRRTSLKSNKSLAAKKSRKSKF